MINLKPLWHNVRALLGECVLDANGACFTHLISKACPVNEMDKAIAGIEDGKGDAD